MRVHFAQTADDVPAPRIAPNAADVLRFAALSAHVQCRGAYALPRPGEQFHPIGRLRAVAVKAQHARQRPFDALRTRVFGVDARAVHAGKVQITQAKDTIDAIGKIFAGEELPKETISMPTLLDAITIADFDWESAIAARLS